MPYVRIGLNRVKKTTICGLFFTPILLNLGGQKRHNIIVGDLDGLDLI